MDENKGVISGLNERGFGFIKVEGRLKDVFFHAQSLLDIEFGELKKGDKVSFEGIEDTKKGTQAFNVRIV